MRMNGTKYDKHNKCNKKSDQKVEKDLISINQIAK